MTARVPAAASSWNVANALTVLRLVLVPVFLVALFHDGGDSAAWRVAVSDLEEGKGHFSVLGELPWWVTVVVLVREVGVTALRLVVIRHGVMPASRGGKVKTMLQSVAIGLLVLPTTGWLEDVALLVMAVAVIVTVVTGVDYVLRALRLRRTSARTTARNEARRTSQA